MLATVTDKGQLTVPKLIREKFGITPGSKLDFEPQADGSLTVRVLSRGAGNLFGILHRPGEKPKSMRQIDDGIVTAVSERSQRGPRE